MLHYSSQGEIILPLEKFKVSYMSSLAGEQNQMNAAKKKLSSYLNDALRAFVALNIHK